MINLDGILTEVSSVAVVSGLIIWAGKAIFTHSIDKRYAAYELELSYKSEGYKSELDRRLQEHKAHLDLLLIKASRFHDKRLEIIAELYKRIVDLDMNMNIMTAKVKSVTLDKEIDDKAERERINAAGNTYNDFLDFYSTKRIFFSETTCTLIEDLKSKYFDSLWDYDYVNKWSSLDSTMNIDIAKEVYDKVHKEIPSVLKLLEQDFRSMINVENEIAGIKQD